MVNNVFSCQTKSFYYNDVNLCQFTAECLKVTIQRNISDKS